MWQCSPCVHKAQLQASSEYCKLSAPVSECHTAMLHTPQLLLAQSHAGTARTVPLTAFWLAGEQLPPLLVHFQVLCPHGQHVLELLLHQADIHTAMRIWLIMQMAVEHVDWVSIKPRMILQATARCHCHAQHKTEALH